MVKIATLHKRNPHDIHVFLIRDDLIEGHLLHFSLIILNHNDRFPVISSWSSKREGGFFNSRVSFDLLRKSI